MIELVVVVTALAVLAVTVTAGVGGGLGRRGSENSARELRDALSRARDFAILSGQVVELLPSMDGWELRRPGPNGWQELGPPGRVAALWMRLDGQPWRPDDGPLRFLPDGRATPFAVRLGPEKQRYHCRQPIRDVPTCHAE